MNKKTKENYIVLFTLKAHEYRFLHLPATRDKFFACCTPRDGIFSLESPWKSESVGSFEVTFMSTVEHRGSHVGTPW